MKTDSSTLLSPAQRIGLVIVLLLTSILLANSVYLWITSPAASESVLNESRFEVSTYGMAGTEPITEDVTRAHVSLPPFYQWMLMLHIFGGLLLLAIAFVFIASHVPAAWKRNNPRAVTIGIALTVASIGLAVSGLFILTEANSTANQWIFESHRMLAIVLPVLYILHRLATYWSLQSRKVAVAFGGMAGLVLIFLVIHTIQDPESFDQILFDPVPQAFAQDGSGIDGSPRDPFLPFAPTNLGAEGSVFFPAPTTTYAGGVVPHEALTAGDVPEPAIIADDIVAFGFLHSQSVGAETCARCHAGTTEQWERSAHRFSSFNNPFYKASIDFLRTEPNGFKRSQWCASCHDPVLLLTGSMLEEIDPIGFKAQSGITCLSCHAVDQIHGKVGNGNYNLADTTQSPYLFADAEGGIGQALHDMLLKSKPTVHKNQMLKRFHRSSEFCMPCHKVSLDVPVNNYKWLRGQNDYDNWHNSGVSQNAARTFYLPDTSRLCQDCHMPMEDVRLPDVSARGGQVRSHTFLTANTALPYIRGDEDSLRKTEAFLQNSGLHVDLFAVRVTDGDAPIRLQTDTPIPLNEDRLLQVDVVIRNQGVGHTFPSGTLDSNECWVQFEVIPTGKDPLVQSGFIQDDGWVDPTAHFYKALFVNQQSEPAVIRNVQQFHAPVYVRVIGPGTADVVRYRFPVPEGESFQIRARLMWRKFISSFSEFVQQQERFPVIEASDEAFELPITTIDESNTVYVESDKDGLALRITDVIPSDDPRPDWMRMNDYGIAHIVQQDFRTAEWAFTHVDRMARERADGPRNLARITLQQGDIDETYDLLRECEIREPGDPQSAWFWGLARMEEGLYTEAVQAFRRVVAHFPEDREAWKRMGRSYYLSGQFDEALDAYLTALAIDPEDIISHYHRMLIYRAQGKTEAADEAQRAFDKYKDNEQQQRFTQEYRLANPIDNKASQSIIVYDLNPSAEEAQP